MKECHNWDFDSVDALAWASGSMWQHLATCFVLLLLQSISREGSKVRFECRSQDLSSSSCLSLPCLVLIQKGTFNNQPLHVLRERANKKHKRQNSSRQRAMDDSKLHLLQ